MSTEPALLAPALPSAPSASLAWRLLRNPVAVASAALLVAMALHASSDHRAYQHVERRKQRRGAVADVVVSAGRRAS